MNLADYSWFLPILGALIISMPPTLVALLAWRTAWINAKDAKKVAVTNVIELGTKLDANTMLTKENGDKAMDIMGQTQEIHRQTNGTLSALREDLKQMRTELTAANDRVAALESILRGAFTGGQK